MVGDRGRVLSIMYAMPRERCLEIDGSADLLLAETQIKGRIP